MTRWPRQEGKFEGHQKRSLFRQNPTATGGLEVQSAAIAKHLGFDPLEAKGALTFQDEEEEEEEEASALPSQ